ncbi:unnamed protein product [Vitrella brassicaformis CCMP3155]|uniref:Uncharacterized protein n=1 Tax=Vitrella brassicaformis (strain CCMP3155) TaxID=1169540 RepID=A0A0G4FQK3_VITBC|nr:unnamed protein product [Vitrella brassicaformis CCMP3155]|eukprot:CEM16723.1 unnamed protein product [Vitrella brassicaformis CCMP3155]
MSLTWEPALGSFPPDKPICARTSESRFFYCIKEDVGLFTGPIVADRDEVGFVKGVLSGQPSSLCFPPVLDPCFNAVNRFAVPFDCAGSLPDVERREDMGPDKSSDPPPVPQNATFAQLVHTDAYPPTINHTGSNVSSCMRIQGKKDDSSGLDDLFLDLSCDTTEGVSSTLQFTCLANTSLCFRREEHERLPAIATIQGVMGVEKASNPARGNRGAD